jgi:two-component system response regulator NreC
VRLQQLLVLLVIPHEVERAGLRLIIEEDGFNRVAGEAAEGKAALTLARDHRPDVVVLDSSLRDVPALALAHFLKHFCPWSQTLLYTEHSDRDGIVAALREGVRAFVRKSQPEQLVPALRALADHRPYWEGAVEDELLNEFLEPRPPSQTNLTNRQLQVLQMVAAGRTRQEMARALAATPKEIGTIRTGVRRKLGLRTMAELIRYATRDGMPNA